MAFNTTASSASPESSSNPKDPLFGDTLLVYVGPDHTEFTVHCATLSAASPVFERASSGPWLEALERKVHFEELEPKYFRVYAITAYTQRVDYSPFEGEGFEDHAGNAEHEQEELKVERWVGLWITADYLGDIWLKNAIMTALFELAGIWCSNPVSISFDTNLTIWDETPEHCHLRHWLLNVLKQTSDEKMDEYGEDSPYDLLQEIFKPRRPRMSAYPVACDYHDHGEGIRPCGTQQAGAQQPCRSCGYNLTRDPRIG